MPTNLAYYYSRFFFGCTHFSRSHYYVFPDYATMVIPASRITEQTISVRFAVSSAFILNYLTRRGLVSSAFSQTLTNLPLGLALPQIYHRLVKPFHHVAVPLSGGATVTTPVFLSIYPASATLVYRQIFSILLQQRFPGLVPRVFTYSRLFLGRTNTTLSVFIPAFFMVTFAQLTKKPRVARYYKPYTPRLAGCPNKRAVCLKVYTTKPKKPNSAIRKIAKVKVSNGQRTLVYLPGQGHSLQQHSVVIIRGGRVPDLPGVRYRAIRGKYDFSAKESFERKTNRSKYGTPSGKKKTA